MVTLNGVASSRVHQAANAWKEIRLTVFIAKRHNEISAYRSSFRPDHEAPRPTTRWLYPTNSLHKTVSNSRSRPAEMRFGRSVSAVSLSCTSRVAPRTPHQVSKIQLRERWVARDLFGEDLAMSVHHLASHQRREIPSQAEIHFRFFSSATVARPRSTRMASAAALKPCFEPKRRSASTQVPSRNCQLSGFDAKAAEISANRNGFYLFHSTNSQGASGKAGHAGEHEL